MDEAKEQIVIIILVAILIFLAYSPHIFSLVSIGSSASNTGIIYFYPYIFNNQSNQSQTVAAAVDYTVFISNYTSIPFVGTLPFIGSGTCYAINESPNSFSFMTNELNAPVVNSHGQLMSYDGYQLLKGPVVGINYHYSVPSLYYCKTNFNLAYSKNKLYNVSIHFNASPYYVENNGYKSLNYSYNLYLNFSKYVYNNTIITIPLQERVFAQPITVTTTSTTSIPSSTTIKQNSSSNSTSTIKYVCCNTTSSSTLTSSSSTSSSSTTSIVTYAYCASMNETLNVSLGQCVFQNPPSIWSDLGAAFNDIVAAWNSFWVWVFSL